MRTPALVLTGIALCLLSAWLLVLSDCLAGYQLESSSFQASGTIPQNWPDYLQAHRSSFRNALLIVAAFLLPGAFSLVFIHGAKKIQGVALGTLALLTLCDLFHFLYLTGPAPLLLFLAHLSFSLLSNLFAILAAIIRDLRDAAPTGNMGHNTSPHAGPIPCTRFPTNSMLSPLSSPASPSAC